MTEEAENTLTGAEIAPETEATEAPAPENQEAIAEAEEPVQPKPNGLQKRLGKVTATMRSLERENAAMKAIIDAQQKGQPAPPADFDAQVNSRAAQLREIEAFNAACNATAEKGASEFKDFGKAVQGYADLGGLHDKQDYLEAINALPNGAAVFRHLGLNLDEAADILEMKPAKMALELAKLSGSLAKPKKQISNAPTPPEPISGNAAPSSKDPEKMSMAEYAVWFEAEKKKYAGR